MDCGLEWDAIVITPLERGLAALARLGLPANRGYPVLADYVRHELIVHVPAGTAHRCTAQGTRSLTTGSWLLVPSGLHGSVSATWLSTPHTPPALGLLTPANCPKRCGRSTRLAPPETNASVAAIHGSRTGESSRATTRSRPPETH
ncbi:hypothetical protein PH213_16300 [Streptomyces sp. SRF1]|uniref:hypothetical protein n=1 Tax=Streptomyces sp. SRF1 TaxID=1549642 RepID=UPI0025AFB8E5|nr:hypothetical protein [Streptomyces sp. SRF1]MDN3056081.1 hypothetical protein [Streptomyces sp. SRF1]